MKKNENVKPKIFANQNFFQIKNKKYQIVEF